MNKIIYLAVIVMLFSCKSNSIAQEKEAKLNQKPKMEKSKLSDLADQHQVEPGTIQLVGSVQSISKDDAICGTSYKVTALVKVNRIISSGSGLVNLLSAGQHVTLAFMNNAPDSKYETLKQQFPEGNEVSLKVKEGLCPDMTQTVYTILTHKIIN